MISSFGFRSARDADKYADFGYEVIDGAPAVKGKFCGRLILDAMDFIDCGTHVIVVGRLVTSHSGSGSPMTYAYYHKVIKGNAPKNAPTYRAPELESEKTSPAEVRRFRCDVCGYVVESEADLPGDFTCPVCGVDRSHFRKSEKQAVSKWHSLFHDSTRERHIEAASTTLSKLEKSGKKLR